MLSGVRTGLKITFVDNKVVVEVKDSDDVSYRECSTQLIINKGWNQYNFAVAARNSKDDRGAMQITDIDIDSIKVSVLDSQFMYDAKTREEERSSLLLMKHENVNRDAGGEEADLDRLFELNVATKMANEQRKNLIFVEEQDNEKQLMFKHYETLKRYRYNLDRFSDQIKVAVRDEE